MFSLICALNILVIKQHLRKPIVKSILIGTKISQVVGLQLRGVVSPASGHGVWRAQKGEGLGGESDFRARQTWLSSLSLDFLIWKMGLIVLTEEVW